MKVYLPREEEIDYKYKANNVFFLKYETRLHSLLWYAHGKNMHCTLSSSLFFSRPNSSSDSDPECLAAYEVIL